MTILAGERAGLAGALGVRTAEGLSVSLERPATSAVTPMIDLLTVQRAYGVNLDALKAVDGLLGTIPDDGATG